MVWKGSSRALRRSRTLWEPFLHKVLIWMGEEALEGGQESMNFMSGRGRFSYSKIMEEGGGKLLLPTRAQLKLNLGAWEALWKLQ